MVDNVEIGVVKREYTLDIVFKYMVEKDDFVSSKSIMEGCEISRTQFYNALEQLKKMRLIDVKVDMNDFRKKYYRAKVDGR